MFLIKVLKCVVLCGFHLIVLKSNGWWSVEKMVELVVCRIHVHTGHVLDILAQWMMDASSAHTMVSGFQTYQTNIQSFYIINVSTKDHHIIWIFEIQLLNFLSIYIDSYVKSSGLQEPISHEHAWWNSSYLGDVHKGEGL